MEKNKNGREQGLSLIELLVSLAIFAAVLGTALYAMHAAQQYSEESRGRLVAMNAARSVLETIKDTTLPNVPAINLNSFIPSSLPGGTITMTTSSATGDLDVDPIATITITVSWTGPKNMARSLQITTMRSQY